MNNYLTSKIISEINSINFKNVVQIEIKEKYHDFKMYDFLDMTSVFAHGGPSKPLFVDKMGNWIEPSWSNNFAYSEITMCNGHVFVYPHTFHKLQDNEFIVNKLNEDMENDIHLNELLNKLIENKDKAMTWLESIDFFKDWLKWQERIYKSYIVPTLVKDLKKLIKSLKNE
jgi:hypothetical protein